MLTLGIKRLVAHPGFFTRSYSSSAITPISSEVLQKILKSEGGGYNLEHGGLIDYPVAWGDMDSFNHINNVKYLRYFESARVNLFRKFAEDYPDVQEIQKFMTTDGIGPIVRSVELAWRYPIKYPDTITVIHKVSDISSDRFFLDGIVISHKAQKVAARIKECIVTVDYREGGVKAEIPDSVRKILQDRQNST